MAAIRNTNANEKYPHTAYQADRDHLHTIILIIRKSFCLFLNCEWFKVNFFVGFCVQDIIFISTCKSENTKPSEHGAKRGRRRRAGRVAHLSRGARQPGDAARSAFLSAHPAGRTHQLRVEQEE